MRNVRSPRSALLAVQGAAGGGDSDARPRTPVLARGRARLREPARRRLHFYPSAAKNSGLSLSRARNSGPQIRQDDSALPGSGRGAAWGGGESGAGLRRAPPSPPLLAVALSPRATPAPIPQPVTGLASLLPSPRFSPCSLSPGPQPPPFIADQCALLHPNLRFRPCPSPPTPPPHPTPPTHTGSPAY